MESRDDEPDVTLPGKCLTVLIAIPIFAPSSEIIAILASVFTPRSQIKITVTASTVQNAEHVV